MMIPNQFVVEKFESLDVSMAKFNESVQLYACSQLGISVDPDERPSVRQLYVRALENCPQEIAFHAPKPFSGDENAASLKLTDDTFLVHIMRLVFIAGGCGIF